MKLTLVHYTAPSTIGGVERVMGQQARLLRDMGHQVQILVSGEGGSTADASVICVPRFRDRERLAQVLDSQDWVIVHNMFTMPFDWEASECLAKWSRKSSSPRFINWVHDVDVSAERFRALDLKALHVSVSDQRREKFLQIALEGEDCKVIPNGLEVPEEMGWTERMERWVETFEWLDQDVVIFHPTRVVARKNLETGLRLTRTLLDRGLHVKYVVTGAPDPHRASSQVYANVIQELRQELNLENFVHFLGEVDEVNDAEVKALYRLCDLVFFPSYQEGFGLPLLEAVMHRVPVLCSDIPIHREVGRDMVRYFGLKDALEEVADLALACLPREGWSKKRRNMIRDFTWKHIYKTTFAPLIEVAPRTVFDYDEPTS